VYDASAVTFHGAKEQQEDEEGQEGHEAPELAEKAHRDLHGSRAIAASTTSSCSFPQPSSSSALGEEATSTEKPRPSKRQAEQEEKGEGGKPESGGGQRIRGGVLWPVEALGLDACWLAWVTR
jgi:hypothetical protein